MCEAVISIAVDVLQGAGTDERVLVEILASRTAQQVRDIIKAYKEGECAKNYATGRSLRYTM